MTPNGDAKLAASLRERAVDAGGPAVDDDQAGPVPDEQPVDDLLGEVGCIPVAIPGHDDLHAGDSSRRLFAWPVFAGLNHTGSDNAPTEAGCGRAWKPPPVKLIPTPSRSGRPSKAKPKRLDWLDTHPQRRNVAS